MSLKIKVTTPTEEQTVFSFTGPRLLEQLRSAGVYVNASCNGSGTCHKCRVRVKEGFLAPGAVDKKAFTEAELKEGWRLSCQVSPKRSISISVPQTHDLRRRPRVEVRNAQAENPVLACDVGSTGVSLAIGDERGQVAAVAHMLNRQVRFGDDVMTRLQAAQKDGVTPLQESLLETIDQGFAALQKEVPALLERALARGNDLYCSGISAITSFLNGWDIASLATSPFQPSQREAGSFRWNGYHISSLPLLGGFVGGDTFAGILALQQREKPETPWMLVDVGTNTEVVLCTPTGELWFASAPAGPAFEGGNISCGMRAEPGAITNAHWTGTRWDLQTFGGDIAQGVCGSGLIDALYEGVKAGLIAKDGYLPGGLLHLTPEISLNAGDVREFQLAKSATRTACDLLMEKAGCRPQRLYLAGAFAAHIQLAAAHGVGLLPEGIPAEAIGNASLEGALLYATYSDDERRAARDRIEAARRQVELALLDEFQALFVKNLDF